MLSCVVHLLDLAPQSSLRKEKQGLDGKDIERDIEELELLMKAECRNYKLESQQLCPGLQGRFSQPSSMSALIMDWNNAFHCRPAL